MPAMAGSAAHLDARVLDFPDVVAVDVLHHFDHQARRLLLGLDIKSKVGVRVTVRRGSRIWIRRMARSAVCTQRTGPLLHDLVDLVARQVLWQYLQVGRSRKVEMMPDASLLSRQWWRWHRLRGLRNCCDGENGCSKHGNRGGSIRGSCLQLSSFPWDESICRLRKFYRKRRMLRRQSFGSRHTFMARKRKSHRPVHSRLNANARCNPHIG